MGRGWGEGEIRGEGKRITAFVLDSPRQKTPPFTPLGCGKELLIFFPILYNTKYESEGDLF